MFGPSFEATTVASWAAAVDTTADRVAFVMANGREIAVALASPDDAATQ